ncbi:MAG: SurA N-terminal domain-containing protein [Alphaproteobacteria bacterium]
MALKELRKASTSRVASIFIALLALSFVLWGINGVFNGATSRGVARVGDRWISAAEYQERYKLTLDQFARQNGDKPLSAEEIAAFDVKDHVLNEEIDITSLAIMGDRLGLAVNDATLRNIIQGMTAFQNIDGKFSQTTYQQRLADNSLTPATFENEMRGEVERAQLRDALGSGAYVPRGLIEGLILFKGEMRQISYVPVDPSVVGDIPSPDDKTLKAYIAAHPANYTQAELRTLTAVLFRPADFAAQVTVPEDEIKSSYNYDIDKYKIAETRSLRVISFPEEASARAAYEAIKSGKKTFEQVGKERGYPDSQLAFKDLAKSGVDDPKVADAAFALTGPGLVEPVNGALAWSIAEVKSITPGRTKALDEVRDQIKSKLALDQSQEAIDKAVNQFEDGRAGGSTMEELSKSLNIPLVKFTLVDKTGKDENGQAETPVPATQAQQLVAAAFAAEQGAENDPGNLKDGGEFIVRVDQVEPPSLKPFDKIADQAREDYLKEETAKRLKARTDALALKFKIAGIGPAATELGKAPTALPAPLRRDQTSDVISPELMDALFSAKQGELIAGPSAKPGEYVIASVTAIAPPDTRERAAGVEALSKTLDESLDGDLVEQYVDASRQRLGVKVDKTTLDNAASSAH